MPLIRHHLKTESESSRRQIEGIKATLKSVQTNLPKQQKLNVTQQAIQAELEKQSAAMNNAQRENQRQFQELKTTIENLRVEFETKLRQHNAPDDGIPTPQCDEGWVFNAGFCYQFIKMRLLFSTAQSKCGEMNAYLAEVTSTAEERFIRSELVKIERSDDHTYRLGGKRDRSSDTWVWSRTGLTFGYSNWSPDEPNNIGGEEDCVYMDGNHGYKWNDAPCSWTEYAICQKRA